MTFTELRPDPTEPKLVTEFTTLEELDKQLRVVRPWWDNTYQLSREGNTVYVNRRGGRVRVGTIG